MLPSSRATRRILQGLLNGGRDTELVEFWTLGKTWIYVLTRGIQNDPWLQSAAFSFIGGQLLYRVVAVSAIRQCESVITVYTPPSWAPPHRPHCTPLGHYRAPGWAPCVISSFPLAVCSTHDSTRVSALLSQPVLASPFSAVSASPSSASPFLLYRYLLDFLWIH